MKCPKCGGSGELPNPGEMRKIRLNRNIRLREMARRLKISAAYLSDLERGKRDWNDAKRQAYLNAILW